MVELTRVEMKKLVPFGLVVMAEAFKGRVAPLWKANRCSQDLVHGIEGSISVLRKELIPDLSNHGMDVLGDAFAGTAGYLYTAWEVIHCIDPSVAAKLSADFFWIAESNPRTRRDTEELWFKLASKIQDDNA
jgi:hypothetical protein